MTTVERAEVTTSLIRAQDALHRGFQAACKAGDLDLAKDLRQRCKALGETILSVNGGPVKISKTEMLGAFR